MKIFKWINSIDKKLFPGYAELKSGYRLTNIARALRKLYFIIIIQLLGFAAFFMVPQGQDMMYVALINVDFWNGITANLFIFYWALQCYLGARMVLTFTDFTISDKQLEELRDKKIASGMPAQSGPQWMIDYKAQYVKQFVAIQTLMPKWFYFIPYLIVIASFIKASVYYNTQTKDILTNILVIAVVGVVGVIAYLLLLAESRWKVIEKIPDAVKKKIRPDANDIRTVMVHKLKDFKELKSRERKAYWLSLIIFALALIGFCYFPVNWLQGLGAISIISFGFACWIVVSYFMSYLDIAYLIPVKLTFFIMAIIFSYWDYDHPVNIINKPSASYARDSLHNYFDKWFANGYVKTSDSTFTKNGTGYSSQKKFPVVMIAAEGGASRSGFWVAKVLARIHDTLKKSNIDFNNQIFSFSSVSGGSLGTGVYYALMQNDSLLPDSINYETYVDSFFKEDMLAPIAGRLIFPEIAHVFMPFTITQFDRVTALEQTWNYVWNTTACNNNYFNAGFLENTFDTSGKKPVWCINSTWTEYGNRAIVSNVKVETHSFINATDVLDSAGTDLPYATGISVSARFPFISPAGHVLRNDSSIGHLVDGGYYENKGALTTYDMVRSINNKSEYKDKIAITIILITNDGEYKEVDTIQKTLFKSKYYKPETLRAINELYEPIASLYNVRSGHTQYAEDILLSLNTDSVAYHQYLFNDTSCKPISTRSYKIDLGLDGKTVPLNWNISKLAEQKINLYLDTCEKNKIHIEGLLKQLKRK